MGASPGSVGRCRFDKGERLRVVLYLGIVLVCAGIGWFVGEAMLPRGAELETAIYPVLGGLVGGVVGLGVASFVAFTRRKG